MDEHTKEKLKVLGYADPPKPLVELITGFKKRIDSIDPRPLSLEALVTCIALYEIWLKTHKQET